MSTNGNGTVQKVVIGVATAIIIALTLSFIQYVIATQTRVAQIKSDVVSNCHDINGLREQLREIILIAGQDDDEDETPEQAERQREFTNEAIARLQSEECLP